MGEYAGRSLWPGCATDRQRERRGIVICFLNAHFSAYALSGDAKIR